MSIVPAPLDLPPRLRPAVPADAEALGALHLSAWQWAYRGLLPDAFLDGLSATLAERVAWRRELLTAADTARCTWVVEVAGRIGGFADIGPHREADMGADTAELHTLYLDPALVGRGVGRALHAQALADMQQRGYRAATLWVLTGNARARRFYAAAGWQPDGTTKTEPGPGFDLHETRYRIDLA